jgi:glycosyltransferase involved in cell wall biosynthesis
MDVSYVVTVYNKARYLPFVIGGLAAQAGGFSREFIFVDDGSTDDSAEVLRRLTAGWPHCRILQQENQGPSIALNRGLAAASGAVVKTLDGDDLLTPGATAALLDALATSRAGLAFGASDTYDAAAPLEAALRRAADCRPPSAAATAAPALAASLRRAQMTTSSWLARAEIVKAVGGCDEGVFVQDYSIELNLAHATPFARLPMIVFLQPLSAPGRQSEQSEQELHDLNLALARFLARAPDLPPDLRRYALQRAAGRTWHYARRRLGRSYASRDFWRYVGARLGLGSADARAIRATCALFRAAGTVRLMAP